MTPTFIRQPGTYRTVRPAETPREAEMTSAASLITGLLRCVLWLLRHGVYVIGFTGQRRNGLDRITVKVAASAYLYRIFGDECAWNTRRQDGALTIYTWYAERFGVRIEWEEVTCVH